MAVQLIYEKSEPKGPDIKNRIKIDGCSVNNHKLWNVHSELSLWDYAEVIDRHKMAGRLKRLPTFTVSEGEVKFGLRTVDPMFRFSLTRLVEASPTPPDSSSPGAEARFAASWDTRFQQEWSRLRAAVHDIFHFKVREMLAFVIIIIIIIIIIIATIIIIIHNYNIVFYSKRTCHYERLNNDHFRWTVFSP